MIDKKEMAFFDAFSTGMKHSICECNCGKIYFDLTDDFDFPVGEEQKLENLSEEYPEKYMHMDGVYSYIVDGRTFVLGCTCDTPKKYMEFIDIYSSNIAKYLNEVAKQKIEEAHKMKVII